MADEYEITRLDRWLTKDAFARLYGDVGTPTDPDPLPDPEDDPEDDQDDGSEGDRQARERYIADRTPELLREYQTPAKWREAAQEALLAPHGDLWHALMTGDTAEAGVLFRAIVMAELTAMARDAAEDEAYRLLPEAAE